MSFDTYNWFMARKPIKYNQKIQIGGKILKVATLSSDQDKQLGYQAVSIPPIANKQGLLFVFDDDKEIRTFHMRNVLFDLDVLCFDEYGFLVHVIRNMKSPYVIEEESVKVNKLLFNKTYSTKVPCTYCIEVLSGWNGNVLLGYTRLKFI